MKYELTFNLLLVRLKGRECNRHEASGDKSRIGFPKPGHELASRGRMDQGIIPTTLFSGV